MAGQESAEVPKPTNASIYEIACSFLAAADKKPLTQIMVGDFKTYELDFWRSKIYTTVFNFTQRKLLDNETWYATMPKKRQDGEAEFSPAHVKAIFAMFRYNYTEAKINQKRMRAHGIYSLGQLNQAELILQGYKGEGLLNDDESFLPEVFYHPET